MHECTTTPPVFAGRAGCTAKNSRDVHPDNNRSALWHATSPPPATFANARTADSAKRPADHYNR
eukprot:15449464-Alexandrium_andersonii.AAC.1